MRYIKGQMVIEARGGFRVLESMGYKSDIMIEYERKRSERIANLKAWVKKREAERLVRDMECANV